MLEEFKNIYDIHRSLRQGTWLGLLSVALFLLWAEGGFPPRAWILLWQSAHQFSHLWSVRGPSLLLPLAALIILSLAWIGAWSLLLWLCLVVARYHRGLPAREARRMAWLAARDLPHLDPFTLPGKQTFLEKPETFAGEKLRLPPRSPQSQQFQQGEPAFRPFLASVKPTAIEDVPTTPEPASIAVATRARTQTVLEVGVGWHTGLTRKYQPNEDSLVVLQGTCTYNERLVPFGLFVVADGMGGHECGQEASRIAIHTMMQTVLHDVVTAITLNDTLLVELLVNGVDHANHAICHRSKEKGKDMGTTLTAALVVDRMAYIVNVGDSRTYLLDERKRLLQITTDHSLVASLVSTGEISPDEVYTHPERNKVYRSLGNREGIEVDWFTRELRRGNRLLLCSDGLWEMVRDPEIERTLRSGKAPTTTCNILVQAALQGGGVDNVSVIVVEVG